MKKTTTNSRDKGLSHREIERVFRELKPAEKVFTPLPFPDSANNTSERWIVTGGSSKPTKLIEVSTWQTGQVY